MGMGGERGERDFGGSSRLGLQQHPGGHIGLQPSDGLCEGAAQVDDAAAGEWGCGW